MNLITSIQNGVASWLNDPAFALWTFTIFFCGWYWGRNPGRNQNNEDSVIKQNGVTFVQAPRVVGWCIGILFIAINIGWHLGVHHIQYVAKHKQKESFQIATDTDYFKYGDNLRTCITTCLR